MLNIKLYYIIILHFIKRLFIYRNILEPHETDSRATRGSRASLCPPLFYCMDNRYLQKYINTFLGLEILLK